MTYSKHKILESGHIELREVKEDGRFHRSVIAPNESIPEKYKEQIEADPNFEKYRTQENADAYEQRLIPEPKSKAELEAELESEARQIATEELINEKIKADPYLSAMANIKAKIDSGEINENARKALRDEFEKGKK